ncbi:hypothetical protein LSAT2_008292 [Lamellibrachia satsuma]|nr:hypothetical protein LSAT2_008292 [Lamellibrachia satsuma]
MKCSVIVITFATILLVKSCYGGKSKPDPFKLYQMCKKACNLKYSSCMKQCFKLPKPARRERCLHKLDRCTAKCEKILQKAKI